MNSCLGGSAELLFWQCSRNTPLVSNLRKGKSSGFESQQMGSVRYMQAIPARPWTAKSRNTWSSHCSGFWDCMQLHIEFPFFLQWSANRANLLSIMQPLWPDVTNMLFSEITEPHNQPCFVFTLNSIVHGGPVTNGQKNKWCAKQSLGTMLNLTSFPGYHRVNLHTGAYSLWWAKEWLNWFRKC